PASPRHPTAPRTVASSRGSRGPALVELRQASRPAPVTDTRTKIASCRFGRTRLWTAGARAARTISVIRPRTTPSARHGLELLAKLGRARRPSTAPHLGSVHVALLYRNLPLY